jgi:hypothetical protein
MDPTVEPDPDNAGGGNYRINTALCWRAFSFFFPRLLPHIPSPNTKIRRFFSEGSWL